MKSILKGIFCLTLLASVGSMLADCNSCPTTSSDCCTSASDCNDCNDCNDSVCGNDVYGKTYFAARPADSNLARRMIGTEDKIHLFGKECFYGIASVAFEYTQTFGAKDMGKYFFFNGKNTMTYGNQCDGTFDIYGINFGTTASGTVCIAPRIRNFVADFDFWVGLNEFICGLWARLGIPINWTSWDLRLNDTAFAGATNFAAGTVATDAVSVPFNSLAAAWKGTPSFGDAPALKCGRICGKQTDTQVAGVHFDLGYDLILKECGNLGVALSVVFPTGTRPCATYLFDAVAGTGKNWQLGANIHGAYQFWADCDGNNAFSIFVDATLTHLFKAKQNRLLGLNVNGQASPGSSWLLLKKFDSDGAYSSLERAANILCCDVKVGANLMVDAALLLQYDWCNFSFGLGYEFWLRTKEKLSQRCCTIAADTYAIKGTTEVDNTDTQSKSTIGLCADTDTTTTFIADADVNVCPALHPRALTNKVFGFIGYSWRDCEWQPYVALGGEVEWGNGNKAFDQWGIIGKLGIAF